MYNLKRNGTKYLLLYIMFSNIFMYLYSLYYIRKRVHRSGDTESSYSVQNAQINIAKKISVITGTFLIIATPSYITLAFPILDYSAPSGEITHSVSGALLWLNSAMNPVFYIWRMNEPCYHLKLFIMQWNKAYCNKLKQEYNQTVASYSMTAIQNLRTVSTSVSSSAMWKISGRSSSLTGQRFLRHVHWFTCKCIVKQHFVVNVFFIQYYYHELVYEKAMQNTCIYM